MEGDIELQASMDFTHAALAFLAAQLAKGLVVSPEAVQESLTKIKDDLRDEGSDLRQLLGSIPEGTQTLYWTAIGSVHDRTAALFQIAMVS